MAKTASKYGSSLSDQQLVELSLHGDRMAFSEIVSRYESSVARTVMGILGRIPEADDVGQETFVRFFQSMASFRWESSLSTYLTRIAINLSLNEIKKKKRVVSLFSRRDDEDVETDVPDPVEPHSKRDAKEAVEKALQKLSSEFKSVVVLRMIDGYSTKETAEILQLPLGTVLSRLSRAQMELKKHLKNLMPEA
jgi:RNA polymerase sigma-70 factor (ECF subfamily)